MLTAPEKEILLAKHEGWSQLMDLGGNRLNLWLPPVASTSKLASYHPPQYFTDHYATQRLIDQLPKDDATFDLWCRLLFKTATGNHLSDTTVRPLQRVLVYATTAQKAETVGLICNLWPTPA